MKFLKFLKQEAAPEAGSPAPAAAPAQVTGEPQYREAPPATQTPAPATPPVVAPVIETVKPELNYKNPAAKQVGDMLKDAGVNPTQARDAVAANGGNCTPEIFQALAAKHGEGMAGLLASQMTQLHSAGVDKAKAHDQAVYTQVQEAFKGTTEQTGEQTWGELQGWARENISKEDQAELNKALKQGGFVTKLAVQELVKAFQESGDFSQEMVGVEGDNLPAASAGGDITRQEYNVELDALLAKGHDYNNSKEVKALQARRARSASRNI